MWGNIIQAKGKLVTFGLLGALGCLAFAAIGELLFLEKPAQNTTATTCLVLDCSGSMTGPNLLEMKNAAKQFAEEQNLEEMSLAVVGFGTTVNVATQPSKSLSQIKPAIDGLSDGGNTAMEGGIDGAEQVLPSNGARYILLFTDGMPNSPSATIVSARKCRANGINIIVVATGNADTNFLGTVTGDPNLVFYAGQGNLDQAFQKAARVIEGLVGSASNPVDALLKVSVWTALLGLGISIALIIGQNWYTKRRFPPIIALLGGAAGGFLAGLIAGAAGQLFFSTLADATAQLQMIGRIAGWIILGGLLGGGLSFFIPNLHTWKSVVAGVIGGLAGGAFFIAATDVTGDTGGRLVGAFLLGMCIGLLVAFVELAFRNAWLEVQRGKEMITVNLGLEPVKLGSGRACQIYERNLPDVAHSYQILGNEVQRLDLQTQQPTVLSPGKGETFGPLTITVRTGDKSPITTSVKAPPPPQSKRKVVTKPSSPGGTVGNKPATSPTAKPVINKPPGQQAPEKRAAPKVTKPPPPPPRKKK